MNVSLTILHIALLHTHTHTETQIYAHMPIAAFTATMCGLQYQAWSWSSEAAQREDGSHATGPLTQYSTAACLWHTASSMTWSLDRLAGQDEKKKRDEVTWVFFFFVCVFGWQFWSCMRLTLSPAKNVWISQPPGDPASSGTARRAGFKDWAALASPAERGICASKQLENCPCSLFVPKFLHALIYLHSCIYIMYVTVCRWTQGIDTIWYNNSSMNAIFIMPRAWNTLVNITS